MSQAIDPEALREPLLILSAASVVIPVFHRLRVSPVLGFMLVGIAVGPSGLGALAGRVPWLAIVTIADPDRFAPFAEFGVVLLLFTIGLELSFERVLGMARLVFGLGTLQFLAAVAVLGAAALTAGLPPGAALVLALALAMSSTAVVIQVLGEAGHLLAPVGRLSFALLLFQDLAVLPVMFALGLLGAGSDGVGMMRLGIVVGQAVFAVAMIVALGRLGLRPLFRGVARTRSPELFMAASLLVVVATALATAAAGLSMAMGALIAGLLLAETEYRRQVEVTIEPFKGLLIGVFLVAIGMSLDLRWVVANPLAVLGAVAALVGLKLAVIAVSARAFRQPWRVGVRSGLLLGPGGEFSFVILALAASDGLLSAAQADFARLVAALSMAGIPLLGALGAGLAQRFERVPVDPSLRAEAAPAAPAGRVVIAGFGRVGQTVAALLAAHRVSYLAIDGDPDQVGRQRGLGQPVYFGDITRLDLLRRLGLDTAQALVVTLDAPRAADALITAARAEWPGLRIVARARDAAHAAHLYEIGAFDAVPETIEASLQLAEAVLVDVGVPMGPVIASIHEKRAEIQAQIRRLAPSAEVRPLRRRRLRDLAGRK